MARPSEAGGVLMPAGIWNIVADQGATFQRVVTWRDKDGNLQNLTGFTARMQVRDTTDDTDGPVLILTTENSRITLGGVSGTVALLVDATTMAAVPAEQYVYDMELISSAGVVTRLVQGTFVVDPEVTR